MTWKDLREEIEKMTIEKQGFPVLIMSRGDNISELVLRLDGETGNELGVTIPALYSWPIDKFTEDEVPENQKKVIKAVYRNLC